MKKHVQTFALTAILMLSTTSVSAQEMPPVDAKRMQEIGQMMGEIQKKMQENPDMTKEEQRTFMMEKMNASKTGQSMMQQQKKQMPNMVKMLKANRKCISSADTKKEVLACEDKAKAFAKELGIEEMFDDETANEDFDWNQETKKQALFEMDKGIKQLEKSLPCIEKANTISELMQCSQQL